MKIGFPAKKKDWRHLMYVFSSSKGIVMAKFNRDESNWWRDMNHNIVEILTDVTHWMARPDPPPQR